MKKILSLFIVVLMLATMLPTVVFAADEATPAGITLTYDVTKNFGAWSNRTVQFDSFTYEANGGLWEYAGNMNNLPTIDNSTTINWAGTDGMQMRSGWWAIKIIVPKSGVYTPKINWRAYKEAAMLDLYLVKVSGELTTADLTADTLIGSINCYNESYAAVTTQEPKALDARYIEAGEYYFVYSAGEKMSPRGTGWVFFGNIALDGAGTDTVIANILAEDEITLPEGYEYTLDTKVYNSVGELVDTAVTYKSSDNSVATVDANGKIVAGAVGSATITASVDNGTGYIVKNETKVHVVDGITIKYDLKKHVATDIGYYEGKNVGSLAAVDETLTNGFYSYFGGKDYDGSAVKYYASVQIMSVGTKIAFKINVPQAGYYTFCQDVFASHTKRMNVDINVYVAKDAISSNASDLIGHTNSYMPDETKDKKVNVNVGEVYFEEAGSYVVTFCVGPKLEANEGQPYALINAFYLVSGEKAMLMNSAISSSASELNVDNGDSATVSATGYLSTTGTAATFTYASGNTKVATVDATSGVVTPVSDGKVTITATANDASVANKLTTDITVVSNEPGEKVEDTKVNVSVLSEKGGSVSVDGSLPAVGEVAIGTKIKATATPDEGYEFAYWRNASGAWLSADATETFTINTNTAVIAVFDKVVGATDTDVPLYFYNGNGGLITSKNVEKGVTFASVKIANPSLTGYAFDKWSIDDNAIIETLTRAVALFKETDKTYSVTVNGAVVASGKKYGESVTVESASDNFSCWKLGEKVISYDKSFTFDVYSDIALTEVTGESVKTAPVAVLDKVDGEYFLTYEVPAGFTKIEAGILFGQGKAPEVGGFHAKATEKTGSGQFTAQPYDESDTVARGYILFKDSDNAIRVIYAD